MHDLNVVRGRGDRSLWVVRLLHYWWPVAMGLSLVFVVRRATGRGIDPIGLLVLLSGIAAAYSVDRLLDPPSRRDPAWLRRVLSATGLAGAAVGGVLAWRLPPQTAVLMPIFGLAAVGYVPLKRVALAKTIVVPMAWTWAVIALPFHDGSWMGWDWIERPVSLPLFLLLASGCLLCDLKDVERDRRNRVPSVPARWGIVAAASLAVGLAAIAAGSAVVERRPTLVLDGVCLAAVGTCPMLLTHDAVGPLIVDVILTLPGLLIATHLT
jgi:hypothetical protein